MYASGLVASATGRWHWASVIVGRLELAAASLGARAGPGGASARMAFLAQSTRERGRRPSGAGFALALALASSMPLARTSGSVRGVVGLRACRWWLRRAVVG